jgi:hypothetical protein
MRRSTISCSACLPWTIARVASGFALLCASAVCAQTAAPPSDATAASAPTLSSAPDPQQHLQGAALVRALREGGLVIYFRHTATDFSKNDQGMRDYDDCANQRPLNEQGRADARAIGRRIAELELPVGVANASPMCRTMEHARLMLGQVTPTHAMRERINGEYGGLRRLLSERVPRGSNRWLVGHGIPFRAVAGPPQLAEGEAVVMRPLGDRWVVLARLLVADWATLRG